MEKNGIWSDEEVLIAKESNITQNLIKSIHSKIKNRLSNENLDKSNNREQIAIIGMSGRYPESDNLIEYWENLQLGRDCIKKIPASRWQVERYQDKVYCQWMGMLNDIDCFDPLFFKISPAEAIIMDPQQRLFMQEAYHALENAGYTDDELSNKQCGVYLGIMSNEYAMRAFAERIDVPVTSQSSAIAAARLSYFLNLKGPAVPVDTACSSSLVAMHMACQALREFEIDMAIVGGVSLYLSPESYIGMCGAGMLSPDGRCFSFDNRANGFVPGEGVGAVILKRLPDAIRDRDQILAKIIGSGINQDGKTNGITAPSVSSQIDLERKIYQRYAINPKTITYIEAHGTGTSLGDPIEMEALKESFRQYTDRKNYCAIGSVKSNIGHTSAAAGVAGLHKVLLALAHHKIPPTINFEKLFPYVP
jgi:acyl transferase domain-containing protein